MSKTPTADAAYASFVAANWERYLRVARLLTGDLHRGEELLQDSLVKVYVRWRWTSIGGDPHAYLRRTLINGNISWWRRRRREQLVAEPPDHEDLRAGAEPDDQLRRALRRLPRGQRTVIVLRHYEDLTEREVAALLRCTVGTVKSQNARALAKLRELLADNDIAAQEVNR